VAASTPRGLTSIVESLTGGKQPAFGQLAALSDLSREETAELRKRWSGFPASARQSLVGRLAELGDDNVDLDFGPVMKVALEDSEPATRVMAAEALWESTDRGVGESLISLLQHDDHDEVRAAAARSLRQFVLAREFEALPANLGDAVVEALRKVAQNQSDESAVRAAALEALGARSLPWVDTLISDFYYSDERPLRIAALRAMGSSAQERWLEYLYDQLQSEEPEFRYEAISACRAIASDEAVEPVAGALDDEDIEVATAAVVALGEIGGKAAIERLRDFSERAPESLIDVVSEAIDMAALGISADEEGGGEDEW
jgi:HEAT repeat protein